MTSLIEDVKRTIKKYNMLEKSDKIVIGVSGGPDSLCLLHVLRTIGLESGYELYAAHLNHQFRGKDADDDAAFVEKLCKDWGIPAFVETFDVPAYAEKEGLSLEEAGREIRYRLFERIVKEVGADRIAVAQNLNDQAETILMRFMRGSGIEGLKGIEPVRGNIVRPLIEIERSRIEEYCDENGLDPRIDKTNLEPVYNRNKIRLGLIPYIENNFNPSIMQSLIRFSNLIKEENEFLEDAAERAFEAVAVLSADRVAMNIPKTRELHIALRRRTVRRAVEKLASTLRGFDFKHFESIVELLNKPTGAAVILPQGLKAYVSYDKLILTKNIEKTDKKCYYKLKYDCDNAFKTEKGLLTIKRIEAEELRTVPREKDTVYIDESSIKEGLVLRSREAGDIFSPIGMKGSKKLKDYLIDVKVPREKRDELELVADGSEIVWIVGGRLSEKYKITDHTAHIIVIKYSRREYNG